MSTTNKQDNKPKIDLGLLEEDDEFEEFPAEDWVEGEEDAEDVNVWEDNWDDDNIEDDFSQQLSHASSQEPRYAKHVNVFEDTNRESTATTKLPKMMPVRPNQRAELESQQMQ